MQAISVLSMYISMTLCSSDDFVAELPHFNQNESDVTAEGVVRMPDWETPVNIPEALIRRELVPP